MIMLNRITFQIGGLNIICQGKLFTTFFFFSLMKASFMKLFTNNYI